MKKCGICEEVKSVDSFNKCKKGTLGLQGRCKECTALQAKIYGRTIPGLITRIYADQRKHSKTRGHEMPNYTKDFLHKWIVSQGNFNKLYNDWSASGYQKELKPSVDRIINSIPYFKDNIQLMSWGENRRKNDLEKILGIEKRSLKAVTMTSKTGVVREFFSMSEASRITKINMSCISEACSGGQKTAGNCTWDFKK